jgi:hypothetical protein
MISMTALTCSPCCWSAGVLVLEPLVTGVAAVTALRVVIPRRTLRDYEGSETVIPTVLRFLLI